MAEGRSIDRWNHTAAMMSLTANIHRNPKKSRRYEPKDFHPHMRRRRKRGVTVAQLTNDIMRFVERKKRRPK